MLIKPPWTRQPQQPTPINPEWTGGMVMIAPLAVSHGGITKTTGNNLTLIGTPTSRVDRCGYGVDIPGTANYLEAGDLFYSDTLMICATFVADVLDANARTLITKRNASGSITTLKNEFSLAASSSAISYNAWNTDAVTCLTISSDFTPEVGKAYNIVVLQLGNGNTGYMFVNGRMCGSASQTAVMQNTASVIQIGAATGNNTNRYWDGLIANVGFWTGLKPYEKARKLSENPWQIFQPIRRIIPYGTAVAPSFVSAWALQSNQVIVGANQL